MASMHASLMPLSTVSCVHGAGGAVQAVRTVVTFFLSISRKQDVTMEISVASDSVSAAVFSCNCVMDAGNPDRATSCMTAWLPVLVLVDDALRGVPSNEMRRATFACTTGSAATTDALIFSEQRSSCDSGGRPKADMLVEDPLPACGCCWSGDADLIAEVIA